MSQKSQPEPRIGTDVPTQERNWLPLAIAAAVVLAILAGFLLFGTHRKTTTITQINAPLDPYAASLPLSDIVMSESANLAGGKVTYVDGSIANLGNRTVSAVTVQVLFHDFNQKVAQNETLSLNLIRSREPYIDTEPVSAAPIAPGAHADFRLIFDQVSPDWDGAYPELRVLHVDFK